MSFDTAEGSFLSNGEQRVRGTGRLGGRNNDQPLTYQCTINSNQGLVTQAEYNFDKVSSSDSPQLCEQELQRSVTKERDGSARLGDRPEIYYISNTEEGVRGTAMIRFPRQNEQPYRFDCVVNLRDRRVTKISYNPTGNDNSGGNNRPTANDQQIIRLCQDSITQRISSNQIDFGGIIGINLGTGRKIEFTAGAETFLISDNQQGVRGNGVLVEGSKQRQVRYECTVNIRQGTVTNLTIQ
jgi:hypothetical protein